MDKTCETCTELPRCSWDRGAHPDDPKCVYYRKAQPAHDERTQKERP